MRVMTKEQLACYWSIRKDYGLTSIIAYNWAVGGNCFSPLGNPIFQYHWGKNGIRCYSVKQIVRPDIARLKVDRHGNPII